MKNNDVIALFLQASSHVQHVWTYILGKPHIFPRSIIKLQFIYLITMCISSICIHKGVSKQATGTAGDNSEVFCCHLLEFVHKTYFAARGTIP